jgi:hypothetical protein
MPTTINAGFDKLRQNLEITELQSATVSTRQQNVREAMEKEMNVLTSFLAGSYQRSTMVCPLADADVDIFIVLGASYFTKYKPAALLDRVRDVLLKTYTKTPKISRNGQAVTITFTDFKVDVVPCFHRQGGGYLIPNSFANSWISTNPPAHETHTTTANKAHAGDIVPLIKMIRGWNREINRAFNGFYLELMTIDVLSNVTISDYSSGVRFVFDKGREKVKFKQIDPAGYQNQIAGLNNVSTVAEGVSRFTTAYNRAKKAEEYARNGKIADAYAEWGKIFGTYFPAYG